MSRRLAPGNWQPPRSRRLPWENVVTQALESAAYVYALAGLKSVRGRLLLRLLDAFADPDALLSASNDDFSEQVGKSVPTEFAEEVRQHWAHAWPKALTVMGRHQERGISPLP